MSKQSKARDKAFQAAVTHMKEQQGWGSRPEILYLRHRATWKIVWDAARTWTEKKLELGIGSLEASVAARDEEIARLKLNLQTVPTERTWDTFQEAEVNRLKSNLAAVTETAKLRLAKIKALEQLVENRDRNIKVQAGIIERQRETARTLISGNTRLRDGRAFLRDELNNVKGQLEETRKHTTSATWKVFEENERLVAELRRVTSLLADAEAALELEKQSQDWARIKQEAINRRTVPRAAPVPCTATMGVHGCEHLTRPDSEHSGQHQCHCGIWWTGREEPAG